MVRGTEQMDMSQIDKSLQEIITENKNSMSCYIVSLSQKQSWSNNILQFSSKTKQKIKQKEEEEEDLNHVITEEDVEEEEEVEE